MGVLDETTPQNKAEKFANSSALKLVDEVFMLRVVDSQWELAKTRYEMCQLMYCCVIAGERQETCWISFNSKATLSW